MMSFVCVLWFGFGFGFGFVNLRGGGIVGLEPNRKQTAKRQDPEGDVGYIDDGGWGVLQHHEMSSLL